jgi:branched-chain amino acid transport system substrate-binding protein
VKHSFRIFVLLIVGLFLPGATASAQSPSIKIGILTDLQSVFADASGQGSVVATEMAIEDYKAAGGKLNVTTIVADFQNKPDVGSNIAREWYDVQGVDAIVDVANSSVALAVSDITRQKNRVFLATAPATTQLTGEMCSPNTVQWYDNYMLASAITLGVTASGPKKWFFVSADYAFGRDLQRIATDFVEKNGGGVVGSVRHPLGVADFSSFLLTASSSDADIIALANAGSDVVTAIKQVNEFQITQNGKRVVAFLAPINTIHALGLPVAQNLVVTEPFYWDLNDDTRAFAERYFARMKRMPNFVQAGAYSAVVRYLASFDKLVAAQKDPKDGKVVIAEMKQGSWTDRLFGDSSIRNDGRVIHPTYLFEVKKTAESTKPWDYYKKIGTVSGPDAALPLDKSVCKLP